MKIFYSLFPLLFVKHLANAIVTNIDGTPFYIDSTARKWDDCNAEANSLGYELASITSAAENEAIKNEISTVSTVVWIGGYQTNHTDEPGGNWAWIDGSTWGVYTNWNNGEPNDAFASEHHTELLLDGTWNDMDKNKKKPCIYKDTSLNVVVTLAPVSTTSSPTLSPTLAPTSSRTPAVLIPIGGTSNFLRDSVARSWDDCNAEANSLGYELASITSAAENEAIKDGINTNSWIGGYQTNHTDEPGGNWAWIDGSTWGVYTNWNNGEPNDAFASEHHTELLLDGTWNDMDKNKKKPCVYRMSETGLIPNSPTLSPTLSPTSSHTPSPTNNIKIWEVGPSTYSLEGGNNHYDGYLEVQNQIGSSVTKDVTVQLFDYNCINGKDNKNSTNAVTIFHVDPSPSTFDYSLNISQANIGDDTGGFVFSTGPSTGDLKFCTRVSTWEGSVQVAFRETNFILRFNLALNMFSLYNIQIEENDSDSFVTEVNTTFSIDVYQCDNFVETTSHAIEQNENLVICLEPTHPDGKANVVHISNFNIKIFAGSSTSSNYVEYNPVWFSTSGWVNNAITTVSERPNVDNIIMISTPVIAQFFVQDHTLIRVAGNCFLEFNSAKEHVAPQFVQYGIEVGLEGAMAGKGCLKSLISKAVKMF